MFWKIDFGTDNFIYKIMILIPKKANPKQEDNSQEFPMIIIRILTIIMLPLLKHIHYQDESAPIGAWKYNLL